MALVRVSEGLIQGQLVENVYGESYYSFKGIPYAAPPVDDLRFKATKPPQPWEGTRNATEFAPICHQGSIDHHTQTGSEDCLYLNVYTPNVKPETLLPVMFYIYGGGFFFGSGNDDMYGPEFLVRLGVILVTFNYRLEALGYLSLNTKDVPGNAGMKDQVAAMRWVKKNIKEFGGDPDNITIFGQSSGAVSIGYHLISPMTKGLFKRAIMQSGVATVWWGQSFEPRERARAVAKRFGVDTDDDDKLYEFFKALPSTDLVNLNDPISFNEKSSDYINVEYAVTSEQLFEDQERFFNGSADEALRRGIHEGVEVLSGYVEHEGFGPLVFGNSLENKVSQINQYPEYMAPRSILLNLSTKKRIEVGKKMKEYYFGNKTVTNNDIFQIVRFMGTDVFKYNVVQWANIASENNPNYYLYKFTRKSERNFMKFSYGIGWLVGHDEIVCHTDDVPYLFPVKSYNQTVVKDSDTFKLIDEVTTLWTNFAKYGNPTPDNNTLGVVWPRYDAQEQRYLEIGQKLTPASRPDEQEMQFWSEIFKQYLPT